MSLAYTIVQRLLKSSLSLAEIQALTRSSLPTVRRSVKALSDSRWIRVVGQAEAAGGRPAMLFGVDESCYVVLGLHLRLPGAQLVISDLSGTVLKTIDYFNNLIPEPSEFTRKTIEIIGDISASLPDRRILGIGIAAPGFIDFLTGDIIAIGRVPTWVNFPICRHLADAFNLPVVIANDVDCLALAEFNSNNGTQDHNMVYVAFREGVKASLFLAGKLYIGSLGNVGLVSTDLLNICKQPNAGDIKQLITQTGLVEICKERISKLRASEQKEYANLLAHDNGLEMISEIINLSASDQRICYPLVQDMMEILSVACASLIHILQPDILMIGGLFSSLPANVFQEMESDIRSRIPPLISNKIIIKQGSTDPRINSASGAARHFLNTNLSILLEKF